MPKPKKSLENAGISDNAYLAIMQRVANDNYKNWELPNSDAALVHALNDNTYNYRGYYNKYPNGKGNAIDHWTDEFKTVYHPTFSKESKYSGKKSQYNPKGITGGTWYGEYFLPSVDQYVERSKFKDGGEDGNWYEQFKANHPVITEAASYLPVVGSAMDVYEAVNNPTGGNIFDAAVSVGSDILGYRILRNMGKALKTMKGRRIYQEAIDRHNLRTGRLKPNKGGTTPASNLAAKEEALMFGYPFAQITNAGVNAGINYGQQERNRMKRKDGGVNIAPSKRGTLTAEATKHGMSAMAFAHKVMANKDNYSSKMVKKANFAINFNK